jgi:hypothetical protein
MYPFLTPSASACPDKCGNVPIPYSIGIGASCAATNLNSYFALICNNSFQPPNLCLVTLPLLYRSLTSPWIMAGPCLWQCQLQLLHPQPFHGHWLQHPLAHRRLHMDNSSDLHVAGCYSYCEGINSTSDGAPCTGTGCCETTVSPTSQTSQQ